MNTLSWLIYAAEMTEKLSTIAGAGLTITAMMTALAVIMSPPLSDFDKEKMGEIVMRALVIGGAVSAAFGTGYIAAPSSRTIYMIAASEAGEQIVTSPDAIEMMGDLKAIIKKRLKDELAE